MRGYRWWRVCDFLLLLRVWLFVWVVWAGWNFCPRHAGRLRAFEYVISKNISSICRSSKNLFLSGLIFLCRETSSCLGTFRCWVILLRVFLYHRRCLNSQGDTFDEFVEGFLDILSGFGWGFFVAEIMFNAEVCDLFFLDGTCFLAWLDEVNFVGDDYFWHFVFYLIFYLLQPHLQVLKAFLFGYIEHHDCSLALSIVGPSNRHILLGSCWLVSGLHVSQMLTRMSWAPTLRVTGAYSTPMVGVRFLSLGLRPMM